MITVILSGGGGTRLWPLSRTSLPKPFIALCSETLLESTYRRLRALGPIYIFTHEDFEKPSRKLLAKLTRNDDKIFAEPLSRNTAPAVAWATYLLSQEKKIDEVVGVFPADHFVGDEKEFSKTIQTAEKWARKGKVVTIGVKPLKPTTGYGYLQTEKFKPGGGRHVLSVKKFIEKPNERLAQKYVNSKNYFWNAGIFIIKVSKLISLFEEHMPELWRQISKIKANRSNLKDIYAKISDESFDYGVMEKVKSDLLCVTGDFAWSDVGTWDEIADFSNRLGGGAAPMRQLLPSRAQVMSLNSNHNFVLSTHAKAIGLIGIENLIVIDTPEALLIVKRDQAQNVKTLVNKMSRHKGLKKTL